MGAFGLIVVSRGESLSFAFFPWQPFLQSTSTAPASLICAMVTPLLTMPLTNSMDALAKAELNGRDFYVQGPAAYSQARAERDTAFSKLRAAHDYVGEMLSGICDQQR
jgi:hypothetical protein